MRGSRRGAGAARFALAAALVILGSGAGAQDASAHPERYPIRRVLPDGRVGDASSPVDPAAAARQEELRRARERIAERYAPLIRHDLPNRPILKSRAGLGAKPTWRELLKAASGPPGVRDTVRLAAFRFEFENDSAGSSTTGEGRFITTPPTDTDFIDPPPHNRAYFEAHLEAMRRYWFAASNGKIHIEYTLFPEGDTTAYRLDDSADYLPEGDPASWTFESRGCGISQLVRDWIAYVDTATTFRFSDYDSYLFIHAGPDLQGDVNGDTPGDIPSFNITYQFPDSACGIDSIYVHDGADSMLVDNAWVCPETISQDFFIGAVNGTMAHEFGHQIGLPDLYNTFFFFPSVGVWDLMDSGDSQSLDLGLDTQVAGLIPGGLSAWSRFFLGVERPLVVNSFAEIESLIPSTLPDFDGDETRPRSILIPITPREYYLIENRQVEIDGTYFVTEFGDSLNSVADADSATGVVLGPARVVRDPASGDSIEVPSYEYDFALPGYGALMWHVDERALNEETIEVNAVNVNFLRRGLRLEEADGLPDIGNFNSFQFRGGPFDPFYEGNNDAFTPDSDPNSRSNDDLETGISVTDISKPGFAMSMRIALAPRLPGFPVVLGDSLKFRRALLVGPTVGSADEDGAHFAAVVGEDFVAALADTFDTDDPDTAATDTLPATGRVFGVPLPVGAGEPWHRAIPEPVSIPCAVADVDGQPGDEVVVLGDNGGVYVLHADGAPWEPAGGPPQPSDSTGWIASLDGRFLLVPTIAPGPGATGALIAAVSDSTIYGLTGLGGPGMPQVETFRSPSNRAFASNAVVVPGHSTRVFALSNDGTLVGSPAFFSPLDGGDSPQSPVFYGVYSELVTDLAFLVWGDLDRDTPGNEWLAVTQEGAVTAGYFREGAPGDVKSGDGPHGARLPGWPVNLGAEVFTYPSLGDLDGDGRLEILIPTEDARVHVLSWNGARRIGWPLQLPPRIDDQAIAGETPLVVDIDGDARAEVVVGIRDGRLMAYRADGKPLPAWPYGAGEPFQYTPAIAAVAPTSGADPVLAVLTAPYDGFLYALPLSDDAPAGAIQWGGIGGDGAHSGGIGALDEPRPITDALLATAGTFAYPNPAHGNETSIRYRLGRAGRVAMKIYDLSGELITETPQENRPAGDNEYHWDLSRVASGVYLCKLEVDDGEEAASTLLKIAVMR
ncbi:MAG: T9SS type A sorting domain-containing protein [bacterium]